MNPRIKEATPMSEYKLKLVFTNGEHGTYDCSHLLNFGVFQELQDFHYFQQVTVVEVLLPGPMNKTFVPTHYI